MKNMTLANIAAACGGTYHGNEEDQNKEVLSITTDSRKAEPGCLFIAIRGERVDGHDFVDSVFEKDALCVLSEQELPEAKGNYILTESTLQAIKDIAEFYRQQLSAKVVGKCSPGLFLVSSRCGTDHRHPHGKFFQQPLQCAECPGNQLQ